LQWQRGSVGKNAIGSIRWPIFKKPFKGGKFFSKIFHASRIIAKFVLNFAAMATEVNRKKCNWQHSMKHLHKLSYRHKNLAKISHTNKVIANFVSNFDETSA